MGIVVKVLGAVGIDSPGERKKKKKEIAELRACPEIKKLADKAAGVSNRLRKKSAALATEADGPLGSGVAARRLKAKHNV